MSIEDILEEMENLLLDAKRMPFTDKRMIDEEDLGRLIDELREALPAELSQAQEMLSQRQHFMERAKAEAQKMIEQAKTYSAKMTDESAINRQAQEQAEVLINQAQQSATTLQNDAVGYADDVFVYLEKNLGQTLETIKNAHLSLKGNNKQKKEIEEAPEKE